MKRERMPTLEEAVSSLEGWLRGWQLFDYSSVKEEEVQVVLAELKRLRKQEKESYEKERHHQSW